MPNTKQVAAVKDFPVMHLREQLSKANVSTNPVNVESVAETPVRTTTGTDVMSGDRSGITVPPNPPVRQGKPPPIESFSGEEIMSVH